MDSGATCHIIAERWLSNYSLRSMMPMLPMLQPTTIRHLYLSFLSSYLSISLYVLPGSLVASLGILSGLSLSLLSFSLSFSHRGEKKLGCRSGILSCSLSCLLLLPLLYTWYYFSPLLSFLFTQSLSSHTTLTLSIFGSYRCFISSPSATLTVYLIWVPRWRSTHHRFVSGFHCLLPCTFLVDNYDCLLHPGCCPGAGPYAATAFEAASGFALLPTPGWTSLLAMFCALLAFFASPSQDILSRF